MAVITTVRSLQGEWVRACSSAHSGSACAANMALVVANYRASCACGRVHLASVRIISSKHESVRWRANA